MTKPKDTEDVATTTKRRRLSKWAKIAIPVVLALIAIPLAYGGYLYAATPSIIRSPKLEHFHFRMQIIVDGQAENFAQAKYQQPYAKGQCTGDLPDQPIHFHDKRDQFTHIHWEGITGGMVLKYYGWNYIGGVNNALGYRFDDQARLSKVAIRGNVLPALSGDNTFHIYTGTQSDYKKQSFNDWINKDLEAFFGYRSNFPGQGTTKFSGLMDLLFPKVSAHAGHDHDAEQANLERMNNLLGNVVIFVQDKAPTDAQIQARFNAIQPLPESTCGG